MLPDNVRALIKAFPFQLSLNIPLKDYTTFQIGGPADLLFLPESAVQITEAIVRANEFSVPWIVIGSGSNILCNDKGFRGMVIRNERNSIPDSGKDRITVSSSLPLEEMVRYCAEHSLTGCEFLSGIPGTVGGAVYMNAGAFGRSLSEILISAEIVSPSGNRQTVGKDYFQFNYRESVLEQTRDVVLSITIGLYPGDKASIDKEINDILALRRSKHPEKHVPCAGSFFKNLDPPGPGERRIAAGKLLDEIGAKSVSRGGARVYEGHANFIINSGNATAEDVLNLAAELKKIMYNKKGIPLQEEVRYLHELQGFIPHPSR